MATKNQDIMLRVLGTGEAVSNYKAVGSAGKGMGTDIKAGAVQGKDGLKGLEEGAKKLPSTLRDVSNELKEVGESVPGAKAFQAFQSGAAGMKTQIADVRNMMRQMNGSGGGMDPAVLSRGAESARGLASGLGEIRNAGLGLAAVGAGGIYLAKSLQQAGEEGEQANAKLTAMFTKIGESPEAISKLQDSMGKLAFDAALPDDDPLNDAAAGLAGFGVSAEKVAGLMPGLVGQSRLYNQTLSGTAEAVGRAFAKGDLAGLARIGVVITDEQKKRLQELDDAGASTAQKQSAMYEVLKDSFAKYALSMTEGMSQGEIAANRQALALDNLKTSLGNGASRAAQEIDKMGASVLNLVGSNPDLAEGAGYIGTYGAYATASIGGLISFGAQLGQVVIGYNALRASQVAAKLAAEKEAAAVAIAGTASATAGAEAGVASLGFLGLAGAASLALAAIGLALYSWNKNKDKILNPTSSTEDNRTGDQKQDDQNKHNTVDGIENAAGNLSNRDKYVVLRKTTQAYLDLGDTDSAALSSQRADALRKTFPRNYTDVTSPEAQKLLDQLKGLNAGANKSAQFDGSNFKGYQDSSADADKAQSDAAAIQKQVSAARSGADPSLYPSASSVNPASMVPAPSLLTNDQGKAAQGMQLNPTSGPSKPSGPDGFDVNKALMLAMAIQPNLGALLGGSFNGSKSQSAQLDSLRAANGQSQGGGSREINLRIKSKTSQRGNGDIVVHLNADDIVIPYMGIGNLGNGR